MEDFRVVELRHRSELAEFSGELHEGEIPPAKGKGTGCELHRREGESVLLLRSSILSRLCTGVPGTRRRGTSFGTLYFTNTEQRSLENRYTPK